MSAEIAVTSELIVQALHLPYGTRIVGAIFDSSQDVILIDVEHLSLPESTDGTRQRARVICQHTACHYEAIK